MHLYYIIPCVSLFFFSALNTLHLLVILQPNAFEGHAVAGGFHTCSLIYRRHIQSDLTKVLEQQLYNDLYVWLLRNGSWEAIVQDFVQSQ